MKKVFTLVVVSLMAVTLFGADKYIRISEMSVTGTTYDWSSDNEVKAKNTNVYVEVPTSTPAGALTVYGSSGKADRFLYVYGNGGTVKDTNRGMVMATGGASVDFYASDTLMVGDTAYLKLSTSDDFKFKHLSYTLDDGQPKLESSASSVDLRVTSDHPSVSETLTLTGKHLSAGEYTLLMPVVSGLRVTPDTVTVGADGKLSASVVVSYSSTVDVPASSTVMTLTIGSMSLSIAVNYSADLARHYMQGALYIDQLVLDNGTGYDIQSALRANNIDFANLDALDTLNSAKDANNLPFLGLKLKTNGAYLAGWLQAGDTVRLRFGNVGDSIKASINDNSEYWKPVSKVLSDKEFVAPADCYMKFETTSKNTVVLKQITINAALKDIVMPGDSVVPVDSVKYEVACASAEHGTVSINGSDKASFAEGETVTLTVTPAEGYKVESVQMNGVALEAVDGVYSFVMPASNVSIVATFVEDVSGLRDVSGQKGAVKFMESGVLYIRTSNGEVFSGVGVRVE